MKFTDIIGREVVDLETASVLGQIDDAIIDSTTKSIMGFKVRKTAGPNDWLDWGSISAIGADAVTVQSALLFAEQPVDKGRLLLGDDVIGGRVLSDLGVSMSAVSNVEFDAVSGRLTSLTLREGPSIAASDLVGAGTYAIVLKHQKTEPVKSA
jgi:sporulation protein YlmC with PRC-barrel domain